MEKLSPKKIIKKASIYFFKPYFLLNLSTLPVESSNFCLPVKNGWHSEHISNLILLTVDFVVKELPQTQVTSQFWYVGCIPFFITFPLKISLE